MTDGMSHIEVLEDAARLTERAAELIEAIAADSIKQRGVFPIALSGGSTPRSLYERLASSPIDWQFVEFYFGDERNVPPNGERSNFRMADETLFRPLNIDPSRIHRWMTEFNDQAKVVENYRQALSKIERFDVVLLGLGDDCHTASLFPNTAALNEDEKLAVVNDVPQLGELRYTFTYPAINSARNVMFLVSGAAKAEAVAEVHQQEIDIRQRPAQGVSPADGKLYWLLDSSAAKLLRKT